MNVYENENFYALQSYDLYIEVDGKITFFSFLL